MENQVSGGFQYVWVVRVVRGCVGDEFGCALAFVFSSALTVKPAIEFVGKSGHGKDGVGVELECLFKQSPAFCMLRRTHGMEPQRPRAQNEVECVRVCRPLPLAAGALDVGECHIQGLANSTDNLLLARTKIVQFWSKRSAQRCAPVSVEISCAFTRSARQACGRYLQARIEHRVPRRSYAHRWPCPDMHRRTHARRRTSPAHARYRC